MAQFRILKRLYLFMCLMARFKGTQSEQLVISTTNLIFCFNSSLRGFRLNATVLEVRNVSSKMACMDDCFAHPCCRSMNYNHAASADHSNKCEFLHDLVENTSHVLEPNSSFDHIFFSQPLKDYNSCCIPEESKKHENEAKNNISMSWLLEKGPTLPTLLTDSCSSSPCLNNGSCVAKGSTGYNCLCVQGISGIRCEKTHNSCKDVLGQNSSAPNGVYYLKSNDNSAMYPVYCHMLNLSTKCDGDGWTLVMKLNRNKTRFEYNSGLYANKETYNVEGGLDGLAQSETKLASYHNTPFDKICLGMTLDDVTNWIVVNYTAVSMYNVIADGNHRETNVTRAEWMSLINGHSFKLNCVTEGFNVNVNYGHRNQMLRIGIAKQEYKRNVECNSGISIIGFGIRTSSRLHSIKWSSGYIDTMSKKELITFGYIFVR